MEATEDEYAVDKSQWGSGPWQQEPDRLQWEHAGFACLIVRQKSGGHLCGYVGVPSDHPWYEQEMDSECLPGVDYKDGPHGGVTYTEKCAGHICHVPAPGMPDDVWWIGFDAAHSGDLQPAAEALYSRPGGFYDRQGGKAVPPWGEDEYRTVDYMKDECNRLAEKARERIS